MRSPETVHRQIQEAVNEEIPFGHEPAEAQRLLKLGRFGSGAELMRFKTAHGCASLMDAVNLHRQELGLSELLPADFRSMGRNE